MRAALLACLLTYPVPARGARLNTLGELKAKAGVRKASNQEEAFDVEMANETATARDVGRWDTGYPCNEKKMYQDEYCDLNQGNYCGGKGVFCKGVTCYCGTRPAAPGAGMVAPRQTILAVSTVLYHATTVPVDTGFDNSPTFMSPTHSWQTKDRNFPHGPAWFAFAEYDKTNPGPTLSHAGHYDSTGLTFAVAAVTQTNLLVGPGQEHLPNMIKASLQDKICDRHCRFSVFEYKPTMPLKMMVFKDAQEAKAFASQVSHSYVRNDQGTAFQLSRAPGLSDYHGYIVEEDNKRLEREVVLFRPSAQLSLVCKHAADVRATFIIDDVMKSIVATIYASDNPSLPWKRVVWDESSATFGRTENA